MQVGEVASKGTKVISIISELFGNAVLKKSVERH